MSAIDDDDDDDIEQLQYKVIVLGDGAVGKTSICVRFSEDKFTSLYKQTVGCDFFTGKLILTRKTSRSNCCTLLPLIST